MKKIATLLIFVTIFALAAVVSQAEAGNIAIIFNGGDTTIWDIAAPMMGDIPGTTCLAPGQIGKAGNLTDEEVWRLQDERQWEIVPLVRLSEELIEAQIERRITKAENAFMARGLQVSRALSLSGEVNDQTLKFLKRSGIASALLSLNDGRGEGLNFPSTFNRWQVEAFSVGKNTTLADIVDKISYAIGSDGMLVLQINRLSWEPVDEQDMDARVFADLCKHIRQRTGAHFAPVTLSRGVARVMRAKALRQ